MNRPMPPEDIGKFVDDFPLTFMPALDIALWVRETFLEPESSLFNQDHYHLYDFMDGQIGFLWASTGFESKKRFIIGLTEEVVFRAHKWQKWRQEQQMMEWFGLNIPEFLITLDANYCAQCSDTEFCALVEHELYHIGHEHDGDMPQFHRDTGLPKLTLRGHDVEEFIGVVRRYGAGSEEGKLSKLIKAGNAKPEIARLDIQRACGTCLLRAA
jgi:hypothetical protein